MKPGEEKRKIQSKEERPEMEKDGDDSRDRPE
jgi:hypothetical protein